MMEVLFQDRHQYLLIYFEVLTEDLLSKLLKALLFVIGIKISSTRECFVSAK